MNRAPLPISFCTFNNFKQRASAKENGIHSELYYMGQKWAMIIDYQSIDQVCLEIQSGF